LAFSIRGRHIKGIIQKVDAQAREAELLQPDKAKGLRFTWDKQTKFVAGLQFVDAAMLRPRASVEIIYYYPFFGDPYATKVTLLFRAAAKSFPCAPAENTRHSSAHRCKKCG
jgi:hypothetical protein